MFFQKHISLKINKLCINYTSFTFSFFFFYEYNIVSYIFYKNKIFFVKCIQIQLSISVVNNNLTSIIKIYHMCNSINFCCFVGEALKWSKRQKCKFRNVLTCDYSFYIPFLLLNHTHCRLHYKHI